MAQKILLGTILFLTLMISAAAEPSVVQQALRDVGSGSVAEMKDRIFSTPIVILGAENRRQAVSSLPASIRENRITDGKLLSRVERVAKPILEMHHRAERIELFLYRDRFPRAALWMGCVLLLSNPLVSGLDDEELAGIVAHELAHAYFMDELLAAQKTTNDPAMRVVELKCDAVAMLTLKLLGGDPAAHLRGLQKVRALLKGEGLPKLDFKSHPSITERALFSAQLLRMLNRST